MGSIPNGTTKEKDSYDAIFGEGIRVAVVGAGVSGICTAAHLLKLGADVTVFERSSISSGVWHFDPRTTKSPSYPSEIPSVGDYETSSPGQFTLQGGNRESDDEKQEDSFQFSDRSSLEISFAPPGPCYVGLRNNVPTTLMYTSLGQWPPGTDEITEHDNLEAYLRTMSLENGVDEVTLFNTRVENAVKSTDGLKWEIRTITLLKGNGLPQVVERTWNFDALVVASGHYNLPRVPDTPGLSEWKALFGDRIIHSKEYRFAEKYKDKSILVIGGGTSALDICRETHGFTKRTLQSTRGGEFDLPKVLLPPSVRRVGAVKEFLTDQGHGQGQKLDALAHIPGRVVLKDGQILTDIDHVIVATGYITSYPFLPQYHADHKNIEDADFETLVTSEGTMVHNLFKDIFYIEDPTLSFVGVPYYTATFSLFDFQAQAVARVLTGKSQLPGLAKRRDEYSYKVSTKGRGRKFHSLAEEGAEVSYVEDLVRWINGSSLVSDVTPMQGHEEEWLETYKLLKEKRKLLREGKSDQSTTPSWP